MVGWWGDWAPASDQTSRDMYMESRDLRARACHILNHVTTNHITSPMHGVSCRIPSDTSHVTSRQAKWPRYEDNLKQGRVTK